ncbi:Alpha/Beta hydrolase protein [Mariannaea sp. PMI_226]|nr:Alpha/Beta hydrolase protein [Mariannaea sp. PMI_226]
MKRHFQISRTKSSASAATPSVLPSGFTFVDDFKGAAASASELSTAIETALDQLSLGADLPQHLKQLVHGLDKEGSTYDNSKASEHEPCCEWTCSRPEAQLVTLAWNCTSGLYNIPTETLDYSQYSNCSEYIETPSLGASVTGWTSTAVSPVAHTTEQSELLPTLVIAIRGSANSMDHVSNLNEISKDATHFIDPDVSTTSQLFANANLLSKAEALAESIAQNIEQYISNQGLGAKQVLITGHSAGGAVASLLFLHFISQRRMGESATFSCITFGSPPSVSAPIDLSRYQSSGSSTMVLNFMNEFDPVCRADGIYMMSLVNLVRSMYGQRPKYFTSANNTNTTVIETGSPGSSASLEEKQAAGSSRETSPTQIRELWSSSRNVWPVPRMHSHHVGPRVLLLMRLLDDDIQLRAIRTPSSEFEKLLFCRLAIHNEACYSERIQLIQDGIFNRQKGWTGKEVQAPVNTKCL